MSCSINCFILAERKRLVLQTGRSVPDPVMFQDYSFSLMPFSFSQLVMSSGSPDPPL